MINRHADVLILLVANLEAKLLLAKIEAELTKKSKLVVFFKVATIQ